MAISRNDVIGKEAVRITAKFTLLVYKIVPNIRDSKIERFEKEAGIILREELRSIYLHPKD